MWIVTRLHRLQQGWNDGAGCAIRSGSMVSYRGMRVLLLTLLAALGAMAQHITMEFDPAADFSRYRTFSIQDGQLNSKNPALNSELVRKRIEAAIERDIRCPALRDAAQVQPHAWR